MAGDGLTGGDLLVVVPWLLFACSVATIVAAVVHRRPRCKSGVADRRPQSQTGVVDRRPDFQPGAKPPAVGDDRDSHPAAPPRSPPER